MILDTNALSAIAGGEPGAVRAFAHAPQVAIPVIILGDYRFGIARSRHKLEYARWLEEMTAITRVLEVDEETAIHYAEVCVQLKDAGTPIPSNDAWIAALARQHRFPILSRDRHFDLVRGVERLGW